MCEVIVIKPQNLSERSNSENYVNDDIMPEDLEDLFEEDDLITTKENASTPFDSYVDEDSEPEDLVVEENNDDLENALTDQEKEDFVIANEALVHFVAKKFQNTRISHDELVDIANLGLVKALNGYRKNRGVKFSTYAHNCMYNEILFFLRKEKKHRENTVSMNNPVTTDKDGHVFEEESRISSILKGERTLEEDAEVHQAVDCLVEIISELNETEQFIIKSRYGLGGCQPKTQKEIAHEVNMSQANISKLEKNIITKISKLMTAKYGFDSLTI